jgi:CRP-like cAMP-binding protein
MDGHLIRMAKGPGWVFGDMTLLFNTPRSASVISKSPCTLWALEKSTFMAVRVRVPFVSYFVHF